LVDCKCVREDRDRFIGRADPVPLEVESAQRAVRLQELRQRGRASSSDVTSAKIKCRDGGARRDDIAQLYASLVAKERVGERCAGNRAIVEELLETALNAHSDHGSDDHGYDSLSALG
jgi:hypothetical protein